MKTLKVILHATSTSYLDYECCVEAPDNAEPDEVIEALNAAVDGSEFEEVDGDWYSDGEEVNVVEEVKDHGLPRWRYESDENGKGGTVKAVSPGAKST